MGPSWYWMPDIFERFFNDFNKKPSDYYKLERLDPAYEVYFGSNDKITIDGDLKKICLAFENEERGAGEKLKKFIKDAQINYDIAIKEVVYRPRIRFVCLPFTYLNPSELKYPASSSIIRISFFHFLI